MDIALLDSLRPTLMELSGDNDDALKALLFGEIATESGSHAAEAMAMVAIGRLQERLTEEQRQQFAEQQRATMIQEVLDDPEEFPPTPPEDVEISPPIGSIP